ncbi:MAG: amidohydrolase [Rhodobacteraceae bacterium PARR1]|nr:MAG: amidohydrolase [Rhodobacteraceae bacterium PARR1]
MTARLAHPPIRPEWLTLGREEVIDPDHPIIDAHHHLFDRPGNRYLAADYATDLASGHNIIASVLVQARGFYRASGPEPLYPVGETDHAAQVAQQAERDGGPAMCAAIVGYADLMLGDAVRPVLEAHVVAGQGRFRGVRHILAWDRDTGLVNPAYPTTEDMMDSPAFAAGLAELERLGLSFDAWLHFHQIPRLTALARRFPRLPMVLNHCGGVLGARAYDRDQTFDPWRRAITDLAACPNVMVKVGGLGMALSNFGFDRGDRPPSSQRLAATWGKWVDACITTFGPTRVMFESNFPVDKASTSFRTLWNAFKRLTAEYGAEDRHAMLCGTAARFYRIPPRIPARTNGA